MKKLTLSLVAASLAASSLGAYAALPTGAAPFQIVVPNMSSGLEVMLEGLYLQPTNSDLLYATSLIPTGTFTPLTTINFNTTTVKPDYDFGFRIGLGYVFPNSGNDAQVNWTHFDHDTTDSVHKAWGSPTSRNQIMDYAATGDASFKLDSIDLDVGQFVSIGTRLQTRLFIGVRGVQLKNGLDVTNVLTTISSAFTPPAPVGIITQQYQYDSKFTGVGPRMGIDTSYHIGNCFGLVGHFATALLVGKVESGVSGALSFASLLTPPGAGIGPALTTQTIAANVTANNQTRVVPAFDAKLGVDYTYPFRNTTSSMSIEAGYQVTDYIDAIDRARNIALPTLLVNSVTSSVGFNGPYLNVNFKI